MKKFIVLLILLFAVNIVFAANTDRYNQGTVVKTETATAVIYDWTVTILADSSDQLHSPVLKIADCNNGGWVRAVVSAASDVNVFYHYGTGYSWFTTVTASNLDATSTTAKYDPLTTALAFRCAPYLIVECDSGSGATAEDEVISIRVILTKDEFYHASGQPKDVGYVFSRNNPNFTQP